MIHIRTAHGGRPSPRMLSALPTHIKTPALGRRAFKLTVPLFPVEIIDAILAHLQNDKATLTICALVCQTWSMYSFQHLYETIDLSTGPVRSPREVNTGSEGERAGPDPLLNVRCRDFLDWLNAPHLVDVRPLIRVLCIKAKMSAQSEPFDCATILTPEFAQALPNIRRLELHHLSLVEPNIFSLNDLVTHLARLPITDLRLDRCQISLALDVPVQLQALPRLDLAPPPPMITIRSLQFTNCTTGYRGSTPGVYNLSLSTLALPVPLRRLHVSVYSVRDFGNLANLLLSAVGSSIEHLSLSIGHDFVWTRTYDALIDVPGLPLFLAASALTKLRTIEFRFDVCKSYRSLNPWKFVSTFIPHVAHPTRELVLALRNGNSTQMEHKKYVEDVPELITLERTICSCPAKFGSVLLRIASECRPEVTSEDWLLQYLLERKLDWARFKECGIFPRVQQLH